MSIGIVTVLYKSDEVLPDFYYSLNLQTYKNFILIFVDNDANESSNKIIKELNQKYNSIQTIYINSKGNIGVAAGNNLGIKKAIELNCTHILLSNNDLLFEDSSVLEDMIKLSLEQNKKIITPKILYFDSKKIWMAGGYFDKPRSLGVHLGNHKNAHDPMFNISKEITYAPTCFMLIEKVVFDIVGLMDEKYFVYVDDTDFIYRCVQKKIPIWYDHTTTILHKVSSSTGGDDTPFYIYYSNRNKIYFVKKHYNLIYTFIAVLHISITRIINFFKYNSTNKKALVNAIIDGLKMKP